MHNANFTSEAQIACLQCCEKSRSIKQVLLVLLPRIFFNFKLQDSDIVVLFMLANPKGITFNLDIFLFILNLPINLQPRNSHKMSANLPRINPAIVTKIIKEGSRALRKIKKVDPRERYVLLYPDSENAYVGMGFNLLNIPRSEKVYNNASQIVNKDLLRLCLEGPKQELLGSLENRHLAAYVTSHATIAKLAHDDESVIPLCKAAGGVGVGFINSLVFSGALKFEDGLVLVQKIAQAMDRASKVVPSGKLAIRLRPATHKIKMCRAAVEHCLKLGIPKEIAVCSVTKQISPHKIEVSGHEDAIKYLETEGLRLFDFYKINRIHSDQNAYHTELMKPAKDFLELYIKEKLKENSSYLNEPETCSVYSATAGCRLRALKNIRKDLSMYPVSPVLTEQLLNCLFQRPKRLAQPNILVLWDKKLLKTLLSVNRRAYENAKLLRA